MRRIDAVNWWRLSFLLVLAKFQLGHCIQVAPDPKTTNTTQAPQTEAPTLAADNVTLAGDSALSASERTRRLIPYMAFYLPRDFPINQEYAIQRPQGFSPINGKHSKPLSVQGPLTPAANGQFQAPQSYMNLRAQPPAIQGNGELMFGPAPSPPQHYLPSAGDVYHQMAYSAAGPQPPAIPQHAQPATPPLSQSLINTKGSNLPALHLLPPGPPGPTVEPIIKHRHKTVQHFPPTKPPALQQLPYEHLQPQLLEAQRHKTHRQPQLKQHHHQPQQQLFVSQHQQQQQLAPALSFRPQTRPKQSKLNLTPFTPTNTLPGHFIPIIYTPVSGNGNEDNNNNKNHDALNYDYGNPTVVLVDDLSPPIETANLQQQQAEQQQEQIQQQFKPSALQQHTNNEYTLVAPVEIGQQQQQHFQQQQQQQQERHHHEQQQQRQQYITATNAPSTVVFFSSQQAELSTGSAASASVNPHSTTSPIYHIINEASAPAQPITTITQPKQTQLQQQQQTYTHQQHSPPQLHSTRNQQKQSNFQSARPVHTFVGTAPSEELQQQQQHESLYQNDSGSYVYLNEETMTPQEKYVRYLQQRIHYNKQQHKQRERIKERENSIKLQQHQQQQQEPQSQIVVLSETDNSQTSPIPPLTHATVNQKQQQQQFDSNAQVNYPQHSPIRHAVYPYPELHVPSNHQPTTNVATVKQVVKIPVRTLVSEALDAFQQQQQQLAAKGPHVANNANGVGAGIGGLYRPQSQYANGLSAPTSRYIDYIVDDPKQSLDDEQYNPTVPPTAITPNQDYYDTTGRPTYKQQPTLRLKPISKSNNYATRRPTAPALQPPPPPQPQQQPLPPPAQSADKPQYIYADSNFGEKMAKPALKLRPSNQYSAGVGSRLTPPQVVAPATSHQFQETKPANLPQYYNPPVPVVAKTSTAVAAADPNQLPDIRSSSLAEILHKLQASNHLPKTLTPENIDNSIKTLVTILENLKQTQTIVQNPPQHHDRPSASPDYDYNTGSEEVNADGGAPDLSSVLSPIGPNKHPGPSTGRAGIDYPNYADIPQTNFNCGQQRYKGFFGDPETKCQVWHYCDLNGGKASFLCPNGTIFSQIALTCDWWFNVKCSTTAQLYVLNERLYKYILPFTPKFPEDYSGPLVDKYLAMKFQEMEEKMRIEKEKAAEKKANDAAVVPTTYTQPNNNNENMAENYVGADAQNDNNAPVTVVVDTEVTTVTDPRTPHSGGGGGHNKLGTINAHVSEQSSERNLLIDDEVDDISKRGGVDTFESSTIQTAPAASMKPIVVSSTQIPFYDDEDDANTYNVRNVDEATSRTPTTETAQQSVQTTTLQEENQVEIQASPKPVRQASSSNIDVEKVEVIEIKSEGASGQMGPKMYYGAESAKDAR